MEGQVGVGARQGTWGRSLTLPDGQKGPQLRHHRDGGGDCQDLWFHRGSRDSSEPWALTRNDSHTQGRAFRRK